MKKSGNRIVFRIVFFFFIYTSMSDVFSETYRFTLLHTSDEHSVLTPLPAIDYVPDAQDRALGGFARLSGWVKQVEQKKEDEEVLLLSSGDYIGGSPFAWLILEGHSPEIQIMRDIGYDAVTIGNHEFDYGPEMLANYYQRAGYPVAANDLPLLVSNLNIPEGHSLNDVGLKDNKIIELKNGLKIGITGVFGEDAYALAPEAEPIEVSNPAETVQRQADLLRQQGAQIVVLLSHSGWAEDKRIAEATTGVDIILGGHDHIETEKPQKVNESFIMHSSYYLRKAGMLEVEYNEESGSVSFVNDENDQPFLVELDSSIKEDTLIRKKIELYTEELNVFIKEFSDSAFLDVNAPLISSEFALQKPEEFVETTVGNFLTDAMRLESEKVLGKNVDIAFQANGVIRGELNPGSMPASLNQISFFDLVTIAGLGTGPDMRPGYPLVSFYLNAAEVYNVFEIVSLLSQLMGDTYFLQVSGIKYTYDPGKAYWLKIPFTGIPVPAYRAVKDIYIYEGEGIQHEQGYKKLNKNDDRLFHMVSDHYLTSFLPMIGEMLPELAVVLKDEDGNPLDVDQTIIYENGREMKVWESLARYAVSFAEKEGETGTMPEEYRQVQQRINKDKGVPLTVWGWSGVGAILIGLGMLVRWITITIRNRKRKISVN
ncbi:MAG: bifunctional metallophosphatase/5'-nucleotidase [Bacteroidota bacterium]